MFNCCLTMCLYSWRWMTVASLPPCHDFPPVKLHIDNIGIQAGGQTDRWTDGRTDGWAGRVPRPKLPAERIDGDRGQGTWDLGPTPVRGICRSECPAGVRQIRPVALSYFQFRYSHGCQTTRNLSLSLSPSSSPIPSPHISRNPRQ